MINMKNILYKKSKEEEAKLIISEAVDIEKEFINESISVDLIGMNSNLMSQYIEYCADRLMMMLGYDKIFNSENPFDWMELISLEGKTNFFEKRVGEYQKAGVLNGKESHGFTTDEDF